MVNMSIDGIEMTTAKSTLVQKKSLIEKLRGKITLGSMIEYGLLSSVVIVAFGLSTFHFLNQSVQSLVPFSAISEVYNVVPQSIDLEFPATFTVTDVKNGYTSHGYASAKFSAKWRSCLLQSVDNNFQFDSETSVIYDLVTVDLSTLYESDYNYSASTSTNDECFQLYCGLVFTYEELIDPRKDYAAFLNNSIYINIMYSPDDAEQFSNGTLFAVNSQLITSITGTNTSVVGSCAVSLAGTYMELMSVSNSVASTGTYLCTKFTTPLQAVSSALSITLSVTAICRLYIRGKNYLAEL